MAAGNAINANWASYVSQSLLAEIYKVAIELASNLIMYNPRDADGLGLRQSLQTHCDIDNVSVNVVLLDDNIAEIYPDAKFNALVIRNGDTTQPHFVLQYQGAGDCFYNARKFHQKTVPVGPDDAAVVFGDARVDYLTEDGFQAGERADFTSG